MSLKIKRRRWLKIISSILLITLLNQIFAPAVAWALTAGPTSPEATSFEPVDTTDMINPFTGDFTYSLPVLEVPGPEGGYPLSLSYHAGIQPNEEASWVGLGWTLNPGAITRNVNGFPDDWYLTNTSRRDYWEGGQQVTYSTGISVGLPGPIGNISFGLSFSQDTYQGFGISSNVGIGVGIGGNSSPLYAGISTGNSPSGSEYTSGYIGIQGKASAGLNVTSNESGVSAGFSASAMGISMETTGGGSSYSVGGFSAQTHNSKAGNISTSSSGFSFGIPVVPGFNINLGFSKVRYWSDETANISVHGSLYSSGWSATDNQAYDNYALPEEEDIANKKDPNGGQGGAYPDYDLYSISAQGMGGNMRPYNFQGEVLSQNIKNGDTRKRSYYSPGVTDNIPEFRFVNDFSNSYRQNYPDYPNANLNLRLVVPPFDPNPVYGNNDGNAGKGTGNKLAGSKSIEYFTTASNGTVSGSGFIKPTVLGLNRTLHLGSSGRHIAGFAITNSSGVTYHYNLPAYSYDEEMSQEKIDKSGGVTFNRQTRNEGYAYTWYLTSITGPDYVDRNGDQMVNEGDWGYWVNFEYGKWSDKYVWRNPSEGFTKDEDSGFQDVSMGRKEIYYLNAIRTRSHIALFEKDVRLDGKSASPSVFQKNSSQEYTPAAYNENSSQSLRLDKIYLLNAADANIASAGAGGSGYYTPSSRYPVCTDCELDANILDKHDIEITGRSNIESKAIKIIDFNYDYSLCKGTTNSYNINSVTSVKGGKLTLNSIVFRGVGGANIVPPVEFSYNLDESEVKSASGTLSNTSFISSSGSFEVGDLLETDDTGPQYCGVVMSKVQSGSNFTYALRNGRFYGTENRVVRTTKNPPYNKDAYDIWGMYKSDYLYLGNENVSRLVNPISNRSADVWSLRKIKTNVGADIRINYEGDTFSKSVLNKDYTLVASSVQSVNSTTFLFNIEADNELLARVFKVGDPIDLLLFQRMWDNNFPQKYYYRTVFPSQYGSLPIIQSINNNQITVGTNTDLGYVINGSGAPNNQILAGSIRMPKSFLSYGGGIRVKDIQVDNLQGTSKKTSFDYGDPLAPGAGSSSGVTTYEPRGLDVDRSTTYPNSVFYTVALNTNMDKLFALSRELPAPGVMYEFLTITSEVKHSGDVSPYAVPGKTLYQYEVFKENMIGRIDVTPKQNGSNAQGNYSTRNLLLKKFLVSLGALRRMVSYDSFGHKLSETINNYLHDDLRDLPVADFMSQYEQRLSRFNYQGLLTERYSEVKELHSSVGLPDIVKATMSGREELPSVLMGQTIKDYVKGITITNENVGFDFYSGAVTKKLSVDEYGNRFLSETIPAYRVYSAMGLKINNSSNRNMLSQEFSSTLYKVNSSNEHLGIVSASVQTWGNNTPVFDESGNQTTNGQGIIWRPQSTYNWMMEGVNAGNITPVSLFTDFNVSGGNNAAWRKTGEITRYNVFSAALEGSDINSNYSATRMGYDNKKVILTGGNARYNEIAYTGAEDELLSNGKLSGTISLGQGSINSSVAHTGTKSVSLPSGASGMIYQVNLSALDPVRRDYVAAVWVKPAGGGDVSNARLFYQIDNQNIVLNNPAFQKVAAGWYLLEMRIPSSALSSGSTLTVGCRNNGGSNSICFDDFRFQPVSSATTAYVYSNVTGDLTYILDNNNLFVKYEYDAAGRMIRIYKEVIDKATIPLVREIVYNYKKPVLNIPSPVAVYARVEIGNFREWYSGDYLENTTETDADLYVRFYANSACTVSLSLPAVTEINVIGENTWNDDFGSGSNTTGMVYSVQAGVSSLFLGTFTISYNHMKYDYGYSTYFQYNYYNSFYISPYLNSTYIPVETYNY